MERPQFITPALSILLDAVRAIAALLVLGGHAVQMEIYTGPYPFGPTVQHYAVIVFFVLSGLVIAHSVRAGNYSLRDYTIARAARILPVSLFAVAFSTAIFLVLSRQGLSPLVAPDLNNEFSLAAILLPALFLSESGDGVGPLWNPPYWSLTYEVWFYALFGAGLFLKGTRRIIVLALLCWIAGWRVLVMTPIWLIGAGLVRYGTIWQPTKGTQAVILALTGLVIMSVSRIYAFDAQPLMFAFHAQFGYLLRFSEYALTDFVFGVGVAMLFVAFRYFAAPMEGCLRQGAPVIKWFAGFSFSLYVLHWPMLSALSALGIGAGDNPLVFLALAGGIIGACALIAQFTEYRSRDIRKWLDRSFAKQQARPEAIG
ncbi:acyltransferase [Qipengyuania sp. 6B39]|uniref:acyltransferase family protein n=1 Tax=Qipengyuania proteolytica TaxID=2867239 RepID=UPI001C88EBB7|nr:acyltransferase [Qipengyuania proteolytica]MBX7495373.1 acyltransferase [Qipengyuania proteolytica]